LPQPPQFKGSLSKSEHEPLQQPGLIPVRHMLSHVPQAKVSFARSVHEPLQQPGMSPKQKLLQAPQLSMSELRSAHRLPQAVVGGEQEMPGHEPLVHESPGWHTPPHAPQLKVSVERSEQKP
jgi:hypothetical protein